MMHSRRVVYATSVAFCVSFQLYRIAAFQSTGAEIVLRPGSAATVSGGWRTVADTTAAGGVAVWHPNTGAPKLTTALASPANFFEVSFNAVAGTRYRLWLRARAEANFWGNDSVFVQFNGSVNASGAPVYRIGTTSATEVNLEDCLNCGVSGWGWQDNGWGAGVLGPEIQFATTGPQVMRVQTREDGLIVDQIVLSPSRYLTSAPGALKNDTTILDDGDPVPPPVTIVRRPYLQQMTANRVLVVWATREGNFPQVRIVNPARTVTGQSRFVPASRSGLGYDYYHHEVPLGGLEEAQSYAYEAFTNGASVGGGEFRTAPATGAGIVTFVAFGDSGTGSTEQRQLAGLITQTVSDLVLVAGDIAYGTADGNGDATYRSYNEWFFDIYKAWLPSRALFTVEGNHDSRPSNGNGIAYLDAFTLPRNGGTPSYPDHAERFYSFDYGRIHFVALDTEFAFQDPVRRAEQLSWLEADLAATTQQWKVAVFHRSPYSAGGEHGSDLQVRAAFAPLFERYGVQLAISAHEHDYERTVPLRESATGTAVTYIVTGGGGAPLYPSGTASWTAYSASRHHYIRATAEECALTVDAIGLDGAIFDTTTLRRCVPPPTDGEVVLYASDAARAGAWTVEGDASAAGGQRVRHPDAGAAKLTSALASPANYFELTFNATAGVPYRVWLRGKADRDYWGNDSVFVQFDGSVTETGAPQFRIGTTSATFVNLEDAANAGISGWGWQDNGYGAGVMGPAIYFRTTGPQRIRIQTREDGFSIDQIVLSPSRYLQTSPGALKNDATILGRTH